MEKTWIKDIKEGEKVKSVFLVAKKATPTSKSGKTYLAVTLHDKTGELEARAFDKLEELVPLFEEKDFVEIEGQRRDPFRSYAKMFSVERGTRVGPQVPVLLGEFSVDDLRVIAIVSGIGTPRAMLVDPQGVGTIVRRGDYVGRGEVVHGGPDGSSEFEVNWRVANIRRGDVVLAREDPTSGTGTPVTRVLPLHAESEQTGG